MRKQITKIVRATQGALAQQMKQPNKNDTIKMILNSEELPGGSWITYLKRDIPVHAFDARDPIKIRVKDLKYTTSRRSFKKPPTSRLIFIEVTPLANPADAEAWTMSASSRQQSKLSALGDVFDFTVLDQAELSGVKVSESFSFATNRPNGVLKTLALVACIENIFIMVACSDFNQPWMMEEVSAVVTTQVAKISSMIGESQG